MIEAAKPPPFVSRFFWCSDRVMDTHAVVGACALIAGWGLRGVLVQPAPQTSAPQPCACTCQCVLSEPVQSPGTTLVAIVIFCLVTLGIAGFALWGSHFRVQEVPQKGYTKGSKGVHGIAGKALPLTG